MSSTRTRARVACVAYARSSDSRPSRAARDINRQLHALDVFATGHGWQLLDRFTDRGRHTIESRPGYARLLRRLGQRPRPDVVLVTAPDRLTRKMSDTVGLHRALKGCHIVAVALNASGHTSVRTTGRPRSARSEAV